MGVLRTFEQSCKSAADASQKQLLSILKDNADTEYGKKYHFSDISSVSEYKKQVPFSTFEDYEDFVSKMMQGKEKLLTAYPVSFYAHTSGTLGAAKHIPYTEKAEEIVHRYASIAREASEYYAHYRQEKKLGPLELILLQPQTFALYRDVQVWNGASPNQLKPIHVITNPKTEAFFRGLKIST